MTTFNYSGCGPIVNCKLGLNYKSRDVIVDDVDPKSSVKLRMNPYNKYWMDPSIPRLDGSFQYKIRATLTLVFPSIRPSPHAAEWPGTGMCKYCHPDNPNPYINLRHYDGPGSRGYGIIAVQYNLLPRCTRFDGYEYSGSPLTSRIYSIIDQVPQKMILRHHRNRDLSICLVPQYINRNKTSHPRIISQQSLKVEISKDEVNFYLCC
jgi:hypothetical protein